MSARVVRLPRRRPPRRRADEVRVELQRVYVALLALDAHRRRLEDELLDALAREARW